LLTIIDKNNNARIDVTIYKHQVITMNFNTNLRLTPTSSLGIAVLALLFVVTTSYAQLTINITSIPSNTPANPAIHMAGNFNNWNPGSNAHKFVQSPDGTYKLTFSPNVGELKFKFTRGTWETVEGSSTGTFGPDRSYTYTGGVKTLNLTIDGWEGNSSVASSASPQVSIMTDSFFIPQLNRYRKIWLYLPKTYQTTTEYFPVLYMHDGQNLFDKKTSFSGEWRVDETMDSLIAKGHQPCIVVGIDNGGSQRLNEYSPWINAQYGGGQGDEYIDFIVKTLKPHIDDKYRTIRDANHTGIMGSSMGGLISSYAGVAYPDVFGKVGAFSPSYWFSPKAFSQVEERKVDPDSHNYLIAGDKEGGSQVADLVKMYQTIIDNGGRLDHTYMVHHAYGTHTEKYWAGEFAKAYLWLFEGRSTSIDTKPIQNNVFQCVGSRIHIEDAYIGSDVNIIDTLGQTILTKYNVSETLGVDVNVNGIFIVSLQKEGISVSKTCFLGR
jgi:predicted alpha/beta superfamily hydrolase